MTTTVEPSLTVGYGIQSRDEINALPDGTVLRYDGLTTARYTKRDGQWITDAGATYNPNFFDLSGKNVIDSLPAVDPGTTDAAVLSGLAQETLTQYKHRFRTITFGVQQRASVNARPLELAMQKLEVPEPDLSLGMPVFGNDSALIRRIPDDSIAVAGHPRVQSSHSVIGFRFGNMHHLLGINTHGVTYRVVSGPLEVKDWSAEAGTQQDAVSILDFKRRAWALGVQAKADNSWCGEYETAMSYAGITAAIEDDRTVTLSASDVAALPEGSIVRWVGIEGAVLMRRIDTSENPAKTERLGGSLPGDWCSLPVELVYNPTIGGEVAVKVHSVDEMNAMPVGTVIGEGPNSGTTWTAREFRDGHMMWSYTPRDRLYRSDQFSLGTMYYRSFPVPTVEAAPAAEPENDLEF